MVATDDHSTTRRPECEESHKAPFGVTQSATVALRFTHEWTDSIGPVAGQAVTGVAWPRDSR